MKIMPGAQFWQSKMKARYLSLQDTDILVIRVTEKLSDKYFRKIVPFLKNDPAVLLIINDFLSYFLLDKKRECKIWSPS